METGLYMIRNQQNYDPKACRTERFSNSYPNNTVYEFNLLESEIKNLKSVSEFKRRFLSLLLPAKRLIFINSTVTAVKHLIQLLLQFSPLNIHRFRQNFDCLSLLCVCGEEDENNDHFFLHFHSFQAM